MDPLGLESILEKFSKTLGPIVRENKRWDEVISCCSGPSAECCSLLEQLRERLARTPANVQQNGEQYVFLLLFLSILFFIFYFHFIFEFFILKLNNRYFRLIARAIDYVNDPTRSNSHFFDESVDHVWTVFFKTLTELSFLLTFILINWIFFLNDIDSRSLPAWI